MTPSPLERPVPLPLLVLCACLFICSNGRLIIIIIIIIIITIATTCHLCVKPASLPVTFLSLVIGAIPATKRPTQAGGDELLAKLGR